MLIRTRSFAVKHRLSLRATRMQVAHPMETMVRLSDESRVILSLRREWM